MKFSMVRWNNKNFEIISDGAIEASSKDIIRVLTTINNEI